VITQPFVAPDRVEAANDRLRRAFDVSREAVVAARKPLAYFAAGRILTILAGLVAALHHPGFTVGNFLSTWDGQWYLKLIAGGYPNHVPEIGGRATESVIGFFPLYPMVVRAVGRVLFLPDLPAAIVTSILFGAAAVVLVHRLTRYFADDETARRAAIFFALFPGSFIFSMVYTEAVMLALAAGCFIALMDSRWVTAGVLAALATASRPNALALAAACGWQALVVIRQRREWKALIAPLLAPAGVLAYFAFLKLRTGDAGAWIRVEKEGWGQGPRLGWHTLKPLADFFRSPFTDANATTLGLGLLFALVALALLLWKRWPGMMTVYVLAVMFMGTNARLDSLRPRALLTAFPLLMAVGASTTGKRFSWLLRFSAALMVLLAVSYNTYKIGQI
jgi:hypothetical protein